MARSPRPQGLYDPAFEHDACGVGIFCRIDGTPSHLVIQKGLRILLELDHRGACGCDEDTGDGAGILIQLPHAFFEREKPGLPAPGDYGVGMVFLPEADRKEGRAMIEAAVQGENARFLGWRRVPTDNRTIGVGAQRLEPAVWQFFVGRSASLDADSFERQLYVIRKVIQNEARRRALNGCYVPSLSGRTVVYKGMLTPRQLPAFYPDLRSRRLASAVAMVHSRFSTNTFPDWSLAQPFRFLCHNGEINTLARQHQPDAGR